jgi:signal transduction histidine kinase
VFAPLDPDHMPIPIIMVSRSGTMLGNHAFEDLHGRHEVTRQLHHRLDVATSNGRTFDLGDLPWERVLHHDFVEEEIWYDRVTSSRLRYCVRGRSLEQGGVLALEDLALQSTSFVDFVEAAARSAMEVTLERTGARLAQGVQRLLAADAVFVFVECSHALSPLATSRDDIAPGQIAPALAAATARADHTFDAADGGGGTAGGRALIAAGLRALVAVPMISAGDDVGVLAIAWRQPCTLGELEKRLLDAASAACANAIQRARRAKLLDATTLHRLHEASLAITDLSSMRGVTERLIDGACELVGATRGALAVAGSSEIVVRPRDGDDAATRALLEELANDDRATLRSKAPPSCLGARLRLDAQLIGSMCVFDKRGGGQFSANDERVLDMFGAQAALALSYSRQLQRAEEAQRRLSSLHDELSAVIAHDMRSPISSMLLQIDLLLDRGDAPPDQLFVPTAAIERLRRAAQRLSRMAEDLLDASRIELGRIALERRPVSLRDAVGSLVAQLEPTFAGRSVQIDAQADAPAVFADPLRLDEIVTNLLENAAKYSQPGRPITVHIAREGGGSTITVTDEGTGIASDELPKLFDRFFQAKRLRSKKAGLGLGLYITKGLVEAHGGRIWVDSVPGEGSQFHVWLPSEE